MIKVLIFDMDGTIIDSDQIIINSWIEMIHCFKESDYKIDIERLRSYSGPPVEYAINDLFPEKDYDFILKEYRKRTKKYYADLKLFDNAFEIINKLYLDGYKLAIVTSKNKEMCLKSLKKFNLDKLFSFIITCESVKNPKPNPEGMLKVLDYFKINCNEAISIGDSEYDYLAARGANIPSILLTMCKRVYKNKINPLSYINNYLDLYREIKKYDSK